MASDPQHDVARMAGAARTEVRRMLAAVDGCDDDAAVRISAGQFRTLALLIDRLATGQEESCGGACMGAPIDGIRFWVPAEQLRQAREAAHEVSGRQTTIADFTW